MKHHDSRGMATAEYATGTLGTILVGAVLYKIGMLDADNPWMKHFHQMLEDALRPGRLLDIFRHIPRFGIRL